MKRSCTHVLGNLWTIGWLGKTLFPTCIPSENFLRWNTWASLSIIPCLFANNVVGNDEDNRPMQVALMTKRHQEKYGLWGEWKNLALMEKKPSPVFWRLRGNSLISFFFICPRQLNNWHCMSLLWDFLRHFFDLDGWLTVREWLGRH